MIDQKQLENVEYFKCLGSLVASVTRCTREIKSIIPTAKTLFTSILDLNFRTKLMKCYIWSTALQGAETWTVRKIGQKYLERFEMWCWRRMEKISWTDSVKNEVLQKVKKEGDIVRTIRQRKTDYIGNFLHRNCVLKQVIEGKVQGTIRRGRRHKQLLDDLKEKRRYWNLRVEALNGTVWRTRFVKAVDLSHDTV